METVPELVLEMNRLIEAARQQDVQLRAFGGLAIFVHSQHNPRYFHRDSPDVDFVVRVSNGSCSSHSSRAWDMSRTSASIC